MSLMSLMSSMSSISDLAEGVLAALAEPAAAEAKLTALAARVNLTPVVRELASRGACAAVAYLLDHGHADSSPSLLGFALRSGDHATIREVLARGACESSQVLAGLCGPLAISNTIAACAPGLARRAAQRANLHWPPPCSREALEGLADGRRRFRPPRWLFDFWLGTVYAAGAETVAALAAAGAKVSRGLLRVIAGAPMATRRSSRGRELAVALGDTAPASAGAPHVLAHYAAAECMATATQSATTQKCPRVFTPNFVAILVAGRLFGRPEAQPLATALTAAAAFITGASDVCAAERARAHKAALETAAEALATARAEEAVADRLRCESRDECSDSDSDYGYDSTAAGPPTEHALAKYAQTIDAWAPGKPCGDAFEAVRVAAVWPQGKAMLARLSQKRLGQLAVQSFTTEMLSAGIDAGWFSPPTLLAEFADAQKYLPISVAHFECTYVPEAIRRNWELPPTVLFETFQNLFLGLVTCGDPDSAEGAVVQRSPELLARMRCFRGEVSFFALCPAHLYPSADRLRAARAEYERWAAAAVPAHARVSVRPTTVVAAAAYKNSCYEYALEGNLPALRVLLGFPPPEGCSALDPYALARCTPAAQRLLAASVLVALNASRKRRCVP